MAFKMMMAICGFIFFFIFILGGFFRLDATSRIIFSDADSNTERLETIQKRIIAHAKELGGECTIYKSGANCRFPNIKSQTTTDINVGFKESGKSYLGNIYVSIHSVVSTAFPENKDKILSGVSLPTFHRDWEKWAIKAFPDMKMVSRTRTISGYDSIANF